MYLNEGAMVISKMKIYRIDIHVQKLCNRVDELFESSSKSHLHKGQGSPN
jgi:hypothetical protein